jgi:hypothetical protein
MLRLVVIASLENQPTVDNFQHAEKIQQKQLEKYYSAGYPAMLVCIAGNERAERQRLHEDHQLDLDPFPMPLLSLGQVIVRATGIRQL